MAQYERQHTAAVRQKQITVGKKEATRQSVVNNLELEKKRRL
jgi:hypothetical protein